MGLGADTGKDPRRRPLGVGLQELGTVRGGPRSPPGPRPERLSLLRGVEPDRAGAGPLRRPGPGALPASPGSVPDARHRPDGHAASLHESAVVRCSRRLGRAEEPGSLRALRAADGRELRRPRRYVDHRERAGGLRLLRLRQRDVAAGRHRPIPRAPGDREHARRPRPRRACAPRHRPDGRRRRRARHVDRRREALGPPRSQAPVVAARHPGGGPAARGVQRGSRAGARRPADRAEHPRLETGALDRRADARVLRLPGAELLHALARDADRQGPAMRGGPR